MVQFRQMNLLEPFLDLGKIDIVFCRNVAIYFTPDTRQDLFERVSRVLSPDGYLFVGCTESLRDIGPRFKPQMQSRSMFYRPTLTVEAET